MRATGGLLTVLVQRGSDDGPPVTIPRDPAREAARHELAKGRYHENQPSLYERVVNRLWDWISGLLDAASGATPGGTLGLVVIVVAVLAAVGVLWWRLGTPRRTLSASGAALFDDRPRSAAEHRATAEAHASQGHWNQAVQEHMRAIVRSLEERALLEPRPGRTADEAAAEAGRSLPAHASRLGDAARDFDDVAYGGRTADRSSYENLAALDRDLQRAKPDLTRAGAPGTGWEAVR